MDKKEYNFSAGFFRQISYFNFREIKPGSSKKRHGSTPKGKPPSKGQKNNRYSAVCDIKKFFTSSSSEASSLEKSPNLFKSSDSDCTPSPEALFFQ